MSTPKRPRSRLAEAGAEVAPAADVFNALSNEHRLRILIYLQRHGPTRVGELTKALDLTVSHTSQQLRRLGAVGLIKKVAPATYDAGDHPAWVAVRPWTLAAIRAPA